MRVNDFVKLVQDGKVAEARTMLEMEFDKDEFEPDTIQQNADGSPLFIAEKRVVGRDEEKNRKQAKVANDLTELESGHVFRMRSAHDIFKKLHREKQRFEKAVSNRESRADQVDAAINFAITAWHMTDWVWGRQQHRLREYFDVSSLREFQDEMRRRCPGLAVCDVIANAAKHGGAAREREDRPEIQTVLIAHPIAEGAAGVELVAVLAHRRWSLKIEVDGTPENPLALLNRVLFFWHELIQQHCVAKQL